MSYWESGLNWGVALLMLTLDVLGLGIRGIIFSRESDPPPKFCQSVRYTEEFPLVPLLDLLPLCCLDSKNEPIPQPSKQDFDDGGYKPRYSSALHSPHLSNPWPSCTGRGSQIKWHHYRCRHRFSKAFIIGYLQIAALVVFLAMALAGKASWLPLTWKIPSGADKRTPPETGSTVRARHMLNCIFSKPGPTPTAWMS